MTFNNPNNRCSLTGYIASDFIKNPTSGSIEFQFGVERKAETAGNKSFADYFCVYVSKKSTIDLLLNLTKKGSVINVKGELRQWFDKTYKICADTITVKG